MTTIAYSHRNMFCSRFKPKHFVITTIETKKLFVDIFCHIPDKDTASGGTSNINSYLKCNQDPAYLHRKCQKKKIIC